MKTGVIWYDNERKKFRVAIGKGQKKHIGRYDTRHEAEIALKAATKAYHYAYEYSRNLTTHQIANEIVQYGIKLTD